jgi:hypothetical protein
MKIINNGSYLVEFITEDLIALYHYSLLIGKDLEIFPSKDPNKTIEEHCLWWTTRKLGFPLFKGEAEIVEEFIKIYEI